MDFAKDPFRVIYTFFCPTSIYDMAKHASRLIFQTAVIFTDFDVIPLRPSSAFRLTHFKCKLITEPYISLGYL